LVAEGETSGGAPLTFAIMILLILLLVIGVLLGTAKKRRVNAS
jgi:hypothetical protein